MPYLVCENCGGYYKLQIGESPDDFSICTCGGLLTYVKYAADISEINNNSSYHCIVCGYGNNVKTRVCSNCGSILKTENNTNSNYDYQNVITEQRSKNKGIKRLYNEINWWGVVMGLIFFIAIQFINGIILFMGLIRVSIQNPTEQSIFSFLGGSMLLVLFAMFSSGFVAVATTHGKNYPSGIINGGLVGAIVAFFAIGFFGVFTMGLIGFSGWLVMTIFGMLIYGALTAVGGVIAIIVRNKLGII